MNQFPARATLDPRHHHVHVVEEEEVTRQNLGPTDLVVGDHEVTLDHHHILIEVGVITLDHHHGIVILDRDHVPILLPRRLTLTRQPPKINVQSLFPN